jgi:transcriptional regulator with XRE-family HTH domain
MNTIGTRLKERRKELKLTQQDIANMINKTRETYCRYELGTLNPDIETLAKIADIFKVSVDYLIGRY